MLFKELEFMLTRSKAARHYIINCDIEVSGFDLERVRELFRQEHPCVNYSYIQTVGIDDTRMTESPEIVDLTRDDDGDANMSIKSWDEDSELGSVINDVDMELFMSDMEWSEDEFVIADKDYDADEECYSESEDDSADQSSQSFADISMECTVGSYTESTEDEEEEYDTSSISTEFYSQSSEDEGDSVSFHCVTDDDSTDTVYFSRKLF